MKNTHTHTHTHIYIYIYIYFERTYFKRNTSKTSFFRKNVFENTLENNIFKTTLKTLFIFILEFWPSLKKKKKQILVSFENRFSFKKQYSENRFYLLQKTILI